MSQKPPAGAAQHPFQGATLARCTVGAAIGKGRTSWVCRAHYEPLDREIAIKILSGDLAETAEIRDHFLGEARAIARLDHENVVKVLDVVEDGGHLCILMEYVAGQTLQERLKAGDGEPLPVKKALRIAIQTARALAAAHAENVVHRDVKPANVILAAGTETVKVVDFGLAGPKSLANRAGTPLYMSPEACQGKRIDEKSDVYALGVCLYQMLTGRLPYTGKTVKAILAAHVAADLVPPSQVNEELGTRFDDAVKKLMVASKGYRPTAAEAVALLEPLLETGKPAGKGRGAGRTKRGRARAPQKKGAPTGVVIAAIVGVLAVLGAVLVILNQGDDPAPETGTGTPGAPPPAVTNGGTGVTTTTPTTPPPPSPEEQKRAAAKAAFEGVEAWVKANPKQWEDEAGRWEIVARDHPDTPHGKQAADKAEYAKERAKQEAEIAERRKELAEVEARAKKRREEILAALKVYDFAQAKKLAQGHTNIAGETIQEWRKKRRRIEYLADEFLTRTNEGVSDGRIPARVVKPDAGGDEVVVGADETGINTKAGELAFRAEWKFVTPDMLWALTLKFVSQSDVEGNVYLAVLAAEIGLEKQSKSHREVALMVDRHGTAKDRLREFFVD